MPEALPALFDVAEHMGQVRQEQARDSLEAQVVRCLTDLKPTVVGGRLQIALHYGHLGPAPQW